MSFRNMTVAASSPPAEPAGLRFVQDRKAQVAAALGVLLLVLGVWLTWALPVSRSLEPLPKPALVLVSAEGEPIARRGAYKEAPVDARRLPAHVKNAFLAIEDRRFLDHPGIDLRGIARAALANARTGQVEQGGSTITQQLAKTAFLGPERSLRRKLQEMLIAFWLELRLSKDEILSRYLSSVYFGDGAYGLRAAARHYFETEPERLTLGEAALLAGLVKAPSALNPTDNPEGAGRRARLVLNAMAEAGVITPEQARTGGFAEVHLTRSESLRGGYFADWVSPQAKRAFDAHYGEVRVATTLESDLQRRAERVVAAALARRGAEESGAGQAALVALRPDGRVAAMVGGRDYRASSFNRATQAKRQPGSAFKLFVYLAALRAGLGPDSLVLDASVAVGDWRPENADDRYAGVITLREAFARSSNVATVRLAQAVGGPAVVRAARDLGVVTPLPEDDPTLALGTTELPLIELTAAYAAVAAGRAPVRPHGLPASGASAGAPLDPSHRAALLDLLSAVTERGTGRAARLSAPTFGKTGTTSSNRDALFIGFAGDLVVGVWVGNDDQTPMEDVSGGGLPAEIWREFVAGAQGLRPAPIGPPVLAALAPSARLASSSAPARASAPPQRRAAPSREFDRRDWDKRREERAKDRRERRKERGKREKKGRGRD